MTAELQKLVTEGQGARVEQTVLDEISTYTPGSSKHVDGLRRLSKVYILQYKYPAAEQALREALGHQQVLYEAHISPASFLSSVQLLSHLVTAMRMSGINPADQSNLDAVFEDIYVKGIKNKLLEKGQRKSPCAQ